MPPPMTKEERAQLLCDWEKQFHAPVWDFMVHKMANRDDDPNYPEMKVPVFRPAYARKVVKQENIMDHVTIDETRDISDLEVLDISEDACVFTELLAEKYKVKQIVCVVRDQNKHEYLEKDNMKVTEMEIAGQKYKNLTELGQFDIIVLKEVLYQVTQHLTGFFEVIKSMLRPEGIIFCVWRPPVPPLPIPNYAMATMRAMGPTQDETLEAANAAGLKIDAYAACCPVLIHRDKWKQILMTRHLPAIRNSEKCTDAAIIDFISKKPETMKFEERIFLFAFWHP